MLERAEDIQGTARPNSPSALAGIRRLAREPLFRLLAINWAIGAFVAGLVTAGLLILDTAGLRTLLANSDDPVVPVAVLFCGLLITLTSAAMGAAIMTLPAKDDGERRGRPRATGQPVPVPALAPVRNRH
ncbi:hypothetical protein GR183_05360 [Stappia sp. GBMRC 2046]|uniref:Uncharacterized protein n=2 Tax=Stappia sediminis TaxID=2692190 RepID=A0A7X3LSM2_9HYPH|nr:hypothetical protein [Stappia sediminis]